MGLLNLLKRWLEASELKKAKKEEALKFKKAKEEEELELKKIKKVEALELKRRMKLSEHNLNLLLMWERGQYLRPNEDIDNKQLILSKGEQDGEN